MGKREPNRAAAAFMRGETGVDGVAAEPDQRDEAEVERDRAREQLLRGRTWLGRELLTWLLWRSESGDALVEVDGTGVVVLFTGRVVLRGLAGDVTEVAARGAAAPYAAQVKRTLASGLLVHQTRLRLTHNERSWEVTLDAEHLDVRAAKLPELLTEAEDDRAAERLDLCEELGRLVDALVEAFLAVRAEKGWARSTVPALRKWMEEDA